MFLRCSRSTWRTGALCPRLSRNRRLRFCAHNYQMAGRRDAVGEGVSMNKVAVFGNAGGGKSALSRRLAEITGLPLYVLDIMQFRGGRYRPEEKDGGKIPDEQYSTIHHDILRRD